MCGCDKRTAAVKEAAQVAVAAMQMAKQELERLASACPSGATAAVLWSALADALTDAGRELVRVTK